jgi:hypothetical protein
VALFPLFPPPPLFPFEKSTSFWQENKKIVVRMDKAVRNCFISVVQIYRGGR